MSTWKSGHSFARQDSRNWICASDPADQRLVLCLASRRGRAGHGCCGGTGRKQRRPLADRAVTVFAGDLDRRARFVVEIAVAVRVLTEVTIDAVHSLFEMNVVEMNGLLELVRIVRRNQVALPRRAGFLCDRA